MALLTSSPIETAHPEIPYDKLGVSLSISPIWKPTDVEAAVAIRAVPYRVLPNGAIDKSEDRAWSWATGSAFEDSISDPALAEASTALMTAIQNFLTAKGA